jgi:hypothetical protein
VAKKVSTVPAVPGVFSIQAATAPLPRHSRERGNPARAFRREAPHPLNLFGCIPHRLRRAIRKYCLEEDTPPLGAGSFIPHPVGLKTTNRIPAFAGMTGIGVSGHGRFDWFPACAEVTGVRNRLIQKRSDAASVRGMTVADSFPSFPCPPESGKFDGRTGFRFSPGRRVLSTSMFAYV